MTLELIAPAKLNLCLEVLSRRPDGYHDIVSVMQTIDLADTVRLSEAANLELAVTGEQAGDVPLEGPRNLAFKAAEVLAEAAGCVGRGARIELEKSIPAGMGLGGGSSDAAAVLRGLNRLWQLRLNITTLKVVASQVGSDVAFLLRGGTAIVTGRGEVVEMLPEITPGEYTLFVGPSLIEDKTRRMYSMLTQLDFTDGRRAEIMAASIRRGLTPSETDYANAFDRHVGEAAPLMAEALEYCREAGLRVLATGSGPGFFSPSSVADLPELVLRHLKQEWGVVAVACWTLSSAQATAEREI